MVEHHRVGRQRCGIGLWLYPHARPSGVHQADMARRLHHQPMGMARPLHRCHRASEGGGRPRLIAGQCQCPRLRARGQAEHAVGRQVQPTARCQVLPHHRLRQRHRRLGIADLVEQGQRFRPRGLDAAMRLAAENLGHAGVGDGLPQCAGKFTGLDSGQQLAAHLVGQQSLDGFFNHVVAHRSPSPFAIIPRKISLVPPRSENDGAASVTRFTTWSNSLPSPSRSGNTS
ncbi:hypothetical protein D3C72_1598520 [compost metagenome]